MEQPIEILPKKRGRKKGGKNRPKVLPPPIDEAAVRQKLLAELKEQLYKSVNNDYQVCQTLAARFEKKYMALPLGSEERRSAFNCWLSFDAMALGIQNSYKGIEKILNA